MDTNTPAARPGDVTLMEHATAALAFEIAARLMPWRAVIARFGISEQQFAILMANASFQKLVAEARDKWRSTSSVAERTRLKAQFSLELCLQPLHQIAQDPRSGSQPRIDAMKLIASIAGMSRGEGGGGGNGEKFVLTLNFGSQRLGVEAERRAEGEIIDVKAGA